MPCEFLIRQGENGSRHTAVACGRSAKFFAARGALGEIRLWLCWQHERYCVCVHQWELRQLPPPEEFPSPPAGQVGG